MKIVVQCAKSKNQGGFLKLDNGRPVVFVADPSSAPSDPEYVFAHPDAMRSDGKSWRQYLIEYNALKPHNPDGLYAAIDLYRNPAYADLKDAFGAENLYVLSAGWGLVRGDFLLPSYNITFSYAGKATPFISRTLHPDFADFNMLNFSSNDELVYLGGRDYIPFFCELSHSYAGKRTVLFNSETPPDATGCSLSRFETEVNTNWHYVCARAFADAERSGKQLLGVISAMKGTAEDLKFVYREAPPNSEKKSRGKGLSVGKYAPLFDYLTALPLTTNQVTLTYSQIEEILSAPLPPSATTHASVWWANGGHSQANCWLKAGFRRDGLRIGQSNDARWVRFSRL
ncbi:MAG: hypothetical protein P1V21_27710 [Rhizobiaceae bacterium]|nr:hypothetical protein [Rhizobiaceae bacterium]